MVKSRLLGEGAGMGVFTQVRTFKDKHGDWFYQTESLADAIGPFSSEELAYVHAVEQNLDGRIQGIESRVNLIERRRNGIFSRLTRRD